MKVKQMANYINNDEHVFIPGMTGSGKTFLTDYLSSKINKRVFSLDTKGTFEWNYITKSEKIVVENLKNIEAATANYNHVIYRPSREELTIDYYNAFFEFCYYLKNNTVLVDEVMQVCPSPSKIPEFYKGILTRGRELDVNVWSCTQRPATIPVVVYSEATHWFVFKLNSANDRKRLSDFTGFDEFMEQIPKRIFYYFNANTGNSPERGTLKIKGV